MTHSVTPKRQLLTVLGLLNPTQMSAAPPHSESEELHPTQTDQPTRSRPSLGWPKCSGRQHLCRRDGFRQDDFRPRVLGIFPATGSGRLSPAQESQYTSITYCDLGNLVERQIFNGNNAGAKFKSPSSQIRAMYTEQPEWALVKNDSSTSKKKTGWRATEDEAFTRDAGGRCVKGDIWSEKLFVCDPAYAKRTTTTFHRRLGWKPLSKSSISCKNAV